MRKFSTALIAFLFIAFNSEAQVEKNAGNWKPWFISSVKEYRLANPAFYKTEIAQVLEAQKNLDATGRQQIAYWNAGAPGYRWREMIGKIWMTDTSYYGILANMLVSTAIYDATLAAWDTKYAYNRPHPYEADSRIKALVVKAESPSYPCEQSVAAGVAATIISKFYPHLADSVNRMAQQLMTSRIAAGMAFPSDTRDGFELGKRIALKEIERTKDLITHTTWDGKIPEGPGIYKAKFALSPVLGSNKTIVLTSASQYRPGPPPDYAKEMAELKNYKQTFRSRSNAFYWANQPFWSDYLNKKIFENNIHLNPPRAARLYAITAVATYDAVLACWDAKYAYWGIRPDQYDTTYKPLMGSPPFPGYPSGHAVSSGGMCELLSYFFPEDRAMLQMKAKEAAESRFQAGIHFRTDNEVGLELGKKVAAAVLQKVKEDGAQQ
jgi:hypothetical protein